MNTTGLVMTVTDELLAELEAAADVFPDYEWDSNTEPFFNGPSGESLGGGSTGFYCVYGQPFEIDDETYDGPTLVEACPLEQAKFICEAKPTIKMLTAELRRLRAENAELAKDAGRYRWMRDGAGYCDTRDIPGMAPLRMDEYIDTAMECPQ